jgi:hypothetical protein
MEKDLIIKALECCQLDSDYTCKDCPLKDGDCAIEAGLALSLINSYEQRIAELTEENERLRAEYAQIIRYPTLYEALEAIIWYDNHSDWLKKLCVNIEKAKEKGDNFSEFPLDEWHTEKHTIWMLLVGMFGDWGTSIRSGWIERHDECIAFINNITKNSLEGL